ncbi:MAG: ribosomal protein L7/L12 [Bacteroidota bacterium]
MKSAVSEIPSEAVAALEQGSKIEAIKIVRTATGLDLKDSKDLVETYLREHQDLQQRFSAIQSEHGKNALMKFLLLAAIAIGMAYLFSLK